MAKRRDGAYIRKRRKNGKATNKFEIVWWDTLAQRTRVRATHTSDHKIALQRLKEFNETLEQEQQSNQAHTVNEIIVNYVERVLAKTENQKNRKKYLNDAKYIRERFRDVEIKNVTTDLIHDKLTVGYQRIFKAAFNYAANESKIIDTVPRFKLSQSHEPRENYLESQKDIDLFLQTAEQSNSKHTYQFIRIALETGQRKTAILQLRWHKNKNAGHVDFNNNEINFAGERKFGRKPRSRIIIPSGIFNLLLGMYQEWKAKGISDDHVIQNNGQPIADLKRSFATIAQRSGFPELTPHDLRRTAITHAVRSGQNTSDQICDHFNISIDTYRKHYAVYEPALSTFTSGLTTGKNASTVAPTVALFPRPHNLRNKNNKLKE